MYLLEYMEVFEDWSKDYAKKQWMLIDTVMGQVKGCVNIASISLKAIISTPNNALNTINLCTNRGHDIKYFGINTYTVSDVILE